VLKRGLRKAFYFGTKYECPVCKAGLRKLLPFGLDIPVLKEKKVFGGGCRPNACCPVCKSFDRERLLYLFLRHNTNIFAEPQALLHVAPEPRLAELLRDIPSIDYLTADIHSAGVMVVMDITNIQYGDCRFDSIICNHVLEHIVDDRKAIQELHRVLKPGGWAILQVPLSMTLERTYEDSDITTEQDRERIFGQTDHVRIYAADYRDRLEEAGFKVDIFDWTSNSGDYGGNTNRLGLDRDERIYFAYK
jgi:SAM-dependent methyltransferase